jgi:hypothetical protein
MFSKPRQWSAEYANIFKDQSVVDAYRFRPGYLGFARVFGVTPVGLDK